MRINSINNINPNFKGVIKGSKFAINTDSIDYVTSQMVKGKHGYRRGVCVYTKQQTEQNNTGKPSLVLKCSFENFMKAYKKAIKSPTVCVELKD